MGRIHRKLPPVTSLSGATWKERFPPKEPCMLYIVTNTGQVLFFANLLAAVNDLPSANVPTNVTAPVLASRMKPMPFSAQG